jgi:hypothetical protein
MGLYAASLPARALSLRGMNTVIFFVVRLLAVEVGQCYHRVCCVCIYMCCVSYRAVINEETAGCFCQRAARVQPKRRDEVDAVIGRNFYLSC